MEEPGTSKPIAETWYGIDPCPGGVLRLREAYVDPYMSGDIWLVRGAGQDLVVDSGMGILPPGPVVASLSDKPLIAVALCGYYDHAGGLYSFQNRLCHSLDADAIGKATDRITAHVTEDMLLALPYAGYDIRSHRMTPAPPTRILGEGVVIDLGDRAFQVLHIPGRTPGSIALWEAATGFLFTGETLFLDPLDREFPPADAALYARSLRRLAELPVTTVFGGHYGSFARDRMIALIAEQLARYPG
jgi:glyoxylase-like metal-dependent hydrolase (beta-lactamase superfamily II)